MLLKVGPTEHSRVYSLSLSRANRNNIIHMLRTNVNYFIQMYRLTKFRVQNESLRRDTALSQTESLIFGIITAISFSLLREKVRGSLCFFMIGTYKNTNIK